MLLLDQGNTRLKWRLRGGAPQAALLGDYHALHEVLEPGLPARLASTAPAAVREQLLGVLRARGVKPDLIAPRAQWRGLRLAYSEPARFGVDRWLALLAARAREPGRGVIVLSAGTALTADAVAANGRHLGGYIAPGPAAVATALPALLAPYVEVASTMPGAATGDCVSAGYSSLYVGALALWRRRFNLPQAALLLTGGDAAWLAAWCAEQEWHGTQCPELVLEGMTLV